MPKRDLIRVDRFQQGRDSTAVRLGKPGAELIDVAPPRSSSGVGLQMDEGFDGQLDHHLGLPASAMQPIQDPQRFLHHPEIALLGDIGTEPNPQVSYRGSCLVQPFEGFFVVAGGHHHLLMRVHTESGGPVQQHHPMTSHPALEGSTHPGGAHLPFRPVGHTHIHRELHHPFRHLFELAAPLPALSVVQVVVDSHQVDVAALRGVPAGHRTEQHHPAHPGPGQRGRRPLRIGPARRSNRPRRHSPHLPSPRPTTARRPSEASVGCTLPTGYG